MTEEVVGTPRPNNAAWNDKSALFLSSLTTGLTGMAGLLLMTAELVTGALTGLEPMLTGVCHGLLLDLSLEDVDAGNTCALRLLT